ncbi:MAG: aminotransferase class V-fold PLP-dependent enzyme [Gemmatimonadaceae bacterium]
MITRRELLAGVGGVAASAALNKLGAEWPEPRPAPGFPRQADFDIAPGYTYINGAYTHPMPKVAVQAARVAAESRGRLAPANAPVPSDPKMLFAKLINAKPAEISYVPNTSTGENLVLNGLGVTRFDGNVVTDALHFDGALVHLLELKKQGLDLRVVNPRDYRVDMRDLEKVVDRKTKLIEVSLVAMYNGFQHDLKAVSDLAHAHGALVYADIIQGAGAVPIDVKATGVDFAACSSFKWLMGDFGLGFLYANERAMEHVVRSQWGYHSTSDMNEHVPPFDPEAATHPVSWTLSNDATGMFEVGSIGGSVKASVGASLEYIQRLGVENIQAHRQPLLKKLRAELPRLGFTPVTPAESTSPIITFAMKDGAAVQRKLDTAKVNARVSTHWIRLSPSVYNDIHDVDRLLEALS